MDLDGCDESRRTVLKGMALGATVFMAGELLGSGAGASGRTSGPHLPRSAPEAQGIDSSSILAFIDAAEKEVDALHSLVLVRHGHIVAQGGWAPYAPTSRHMLFSLSKSFTSTAVGMAVADGKLSVDDRVISFFPGDAPSPASENLAAMRVRDLLTMTSGHDKDTLGALFERADGNWTKAFLALPVEHPPGTHFLYNTGATYMLSAIVQKVTGQKVRDYLQPRLFGPLAIEGATWDESPQGVTTGGWGLSITTEEIARFGQLYLQKGVWRGQRLVPEAWVHDATSKQVSNGSKPDSDWEQGYGYQFWRCRHNAYRGDGAFGQYCVVLPEKDAVIAITSGLGDMQVPLNLIWSHLLPGMKDGPLPRSSDSDALAKRLDGLALKTVPGERTSPIAERVAGRTYAFGPNEPKIDRMAFHFDGDRATIHISDPGGDHPVECGYNRWIPGTAVVGAPEPRKAAASGAWTDPATYTARLCLVETPFVPTITCRFDGDQVTVTFKDNVGFGPTDHPPLVGKTGA